MKLIIVESPTKARTISHFLENNFLVESCNGHIRDLPRGKMGIEIENNFNPIYVIPTRQRKNVNKIKKIADKADVIYFATDEDREGEAISWHLNQILNPKKYFRIAFHEITEEAIKKSLKNPRQIDLNLVNAQQVRRILDRLVGYELSPFLWKKMVKGLSAGRVQSPALRLIAEREKEIKNFKPEEYWSITALLSNKENQFLADLIKIDNQPVPKPGIKSKDEVDKIINALKGASYQVSDIQRKKIKKSPTPPFLTSTLQQEANKKLGFSAKKTMFIAQNLYEGIDLGVKERIGLITYMRTDSLNLAQQFLIETEKFIKNEYGEKFLAIRQYKTKVKVAQEAHEAIRPTSILRTPEKIKEYLTPEQYKLYDLIWRRALASQMSSAIFNSIRIDIRAKNYLFRATGQTIKFEGWLKIYSEKQVENYLPDLKLNQELQLIKLKTGQHFTEPPPRYTEARLVKALEKYGIGRPSTYAPIISTIQERNYVQKEKGKFRPTEIGVLVNDLLVNHFPNVVDYKFTAEMENDLDEIAIGKKNWVEMIKNFYQPFKQNLVKKEKEIAKSFFDEKTDQICPKCGKSLLIKMGRFGKFLACSGFPECKFTKSLFAAEKLTDNKNKLDIKCPKCGQGQVVKKRTRKRRFFYGCSLWPKCDWASWTKPKIKSG